MNPLMSEILSKAEFNEADITYSETKEYPYLFNAAAFNETTMDWVVVSRVRLTKQDHSALCLTFSKTFNKCSLDHSSFKPGESLFAVVTDCSDAEVRGLLVKKLDSLWSVGAVCTGTAHGSKYVTEFHVPRIRT